MIRIMLFDNKSRPICCRYVLETNQLTINKTQLLLKLLLISVCRLLYIQNTLQAESTGYQAVCKQSIETVIIIVFMLRVVWKFRQRRLLHSISVSCYRIRRWDLCVPSSRSPSTHPLYSLHSYPLPAIWNRVRTQHARV